MSSSRREKEPRFPDEDKSLSGLTGTVCLTDSRGWSELQCYDARTLTYSHSVPLGEQLGEGASKHRTNKMWNGRIVSIPSEESEGGAHLTLVCEAVQAGWGIEREMGVVDVDDVEKRPTGIVRRMHVKHRGPITALKCIGCADEDSLRVVSAGRKRVCVSCVVTGRTLVDLAYVPPLTYAMTSLDYHNNGRIAVAGDGQCFVEDCAVGLYDLSNHGRRSRAFEGHRKAVTGLDSDGDKIFSASRDHKLKIWNPGTGGSGLVDELTLVSSLESVHYVEPKHLIVCGVSSAVSPLTIIVFDLRNLRSKLTRFALPASSASGWQTTRVSACETRFLSTNAVGELFSWDAEDGKKVFTKKLFRSVARRVSISGLCLLHEEMSEEVKRMEERRMSFLCAGIESALVPTVRVSTVGGVLRCFRWSLTAQKGL